MFILIFCHQSQKPEIQSIQCVSLWLTALVAKPIPGNDIHRVKFNGLAWKGSYELLMRESRKKCRLYTEMIISEYLDQSAESPSCEHGIYASRQCALIARNDACAAGEMPFDKAPNRNLKNTFRVPSGFWECMTLNREMISLECALPLCSPFSPELSKWVARSRQIISRRVHVHSLNSSAGRQRVRTSDTYKVAQLVQTLLESWQSN